MYVKPDYTISTTIYNTYKNNQKINIGIEMGMINIDF